MRLFTYRKGEYDMILDTKSRGMSLFYGDIQWEFASDSRIVYKDGSILHFADCAVKDEIYKTGLGEGIRSEYTKGDLSFETLVWIENSTKNLWMEWNILSGDADIDRVFFPGTVQFASDKSDWVSLINYEQGILLPNNWDTELTKLPFGGQLCSCAAYMPWFAQIKERAGYLAVNTTPWDAGYTCNHPAGGGKTELAYYHLPTLGKMAYKRVLRYTFFADCDYNDICKCYRDYVKETGHFTSLYEKAAKNPNVEKLIGAGFVHCGIKTHVAQNSEFFDPAAPDKNNSLTPFAVRAKEIKQYKQAGVEKLYLHLDGWGNPGYDNKHPDYLPACIEAGGWDGMRALVDTVHDCGYLFGVHDQYRDYYHAAESFNESFGIHDVTGKPFYMARWAGGPQSYLCATQVNGYVRRNFSELKNQGIKLDAAYLDVFTCNEPDECSHPAHRMSRKDCLSYRGQAFDYLTANGIVPSSEEVNDWAAKSLVFCHYAPYDFMLADPKASKHGIPIPLLNLVYHDAFIIPWPMDITETGEDYMLYVLLNGGAAYITRNAAYPGIDGAFEGKALSLEQRIARYKEVAKLQQKVAYLPLAKHELLNEKGSKQRSIFADGTTVTVDLEAMTYEIAYAESCNHL